MEPELTLHRLNFINSHLPASLFSSKRSNRHLVEIKIQIDFYTEVMNLFWLSPLTLNL